MQANFNPDYCFNKISGKLNSSNTDKKKIVNSNSNVKKPLLSGADKISYKTMN
jgi:hypothetical protein